MKQPSLRTYLMQPLFAVAAAAALLACGGNIERQAAKAQAPAPSTASEAALTISVDALHERLQSSQEKPLLVDVREPSEYAVTHIAGARLAPLGGVEKNLAATDRHREIVLVCRSGRRSGQAYHRLKAQGFTNLRNLEGGMLAWEKRGYPAVKP